VVVVYHELEEEMIKNNDMEKIIWWLVAGDDGVWPNSIEKKTLVSIV
jgi:hypothetical protein